MGNKEVRVFKEGVHMFLALARTKDGQKQRCIRHVVKDYGMDLAILESKLRVLGGEWRIHMTVNERDTAKATKTLLKMLIDEPTLGQVADSTWRTALLQRGCVYGEKKFMLDVDTKDMMDIRRLEETIGKSGGWVTDVIETPNGFHYITKPFDTREVCKLPNVTLLRDGYRFVKVVKP